VNGLGAIEEGTELGDYYIEDTFTRRLALRGAQFGGLTIGAMTIGGVGYAAYLKYTKKKSSTKPKSLLRKTKDKLKRR